MFMVLSIMVMVGMVMICMVIVLVWGGVPECDAYPCETFT